MNTSPGRSGRNLAAPVIIALAAASIAACSSPSVPAAFRPACGHPGAKVRVTAAKLPVTIKHSDCDLTGVSIALIGGASATVPEPGSSNTGLADTIDGPSGLTITVAAGTLDVTINGNVPAGSA